MSIFKESMEEMDRLHTINPETKAVPPERLTKPSQLRAIHEKYEKEDEQGSFNRSLIQQMMDFSPPHDDAELEDKGQSDRFNFTTGEGPAIKNDAVSGYMDIYTTPRMLAMIPLLPEADPIMKGTWQTILAEEFTIMDRNDDASVPRHLQLCDTYVTHGVAIAFFDDKNTMRYSVAGLDKFKFPRKTGIVSSEATFCSASGVMSVTALYDKIKDMESDNEDGWIKQSVINAIIQAARHSGQKNWDQWEEIQREIKANDLYVSSLCDEVEVIFGWVKEFNGKISFYISTKNTLLDQDGNSNEEDFLFKGRYFYDSADQAFQIFAFSTGNGGLLYTVRGLGYLIYQICNAMDIMHCKFLDIARIASSLIIQPASSEDMRDMELVDFGAGVAIPPNAKIVERPMAQNLQNSLVPALEASRYILNRSTGGMASGGIMMNPENDRRTKLEVSAQLDYLNKLNSFAINLFYGPYDKIMREKVRRAFSVLQNDLEAKERITEMKKRCIDRGVPESVFDLIDYKNVRATRIIGTGSRVSRIMLMDQIQQMYGTWDAVGRENFDYDYLVELGGVELANRYAGKPDEKRIPYDASIAQLENFQLAEGDYMPPLDGQNHMVHLEYHLIDLEADLEAVESGEMDLVDWYKENGMIYKHAVATMEVATVHPSIEKELNTFRQRLQQIGEIALNAEKALNKQIREGEEAAQQGAEGAGNPEAEAEAAKVDEARSKLRMEEDKHRMQMRHEMEMHQEKLRQLKETGEQKRVTDAQKALSQIALKDAEVQHEKQMEKNRHNK